MKDEINEQEFESKWEADIAYGDPLLLFPLLHYTPRARKHIMHIFLFFWGGGNGSDCKDERTTK